MDHSLILFYLPLLSHVLLVLPFQEQEWITALGVMFSEEDANRLEITIRDIISANGVQEPQSHEEAILFELQRTSRRTVKNKVEFELLVEVLLDFQLLAHGRFLHELSMAFNEMDGSEYGVISGSLCIELFASQLSFQLPRSRLNQSIGTFLQRVDPNVGDFAFKEVTFSECVTLYKELRSQ